MVNKSRDRRSYDRAQRMIVLNSKLIRLEEKRQQLLRIATKARLTGELTLAQIEILKEPIVAKNNAELFRKRRASLMKIEQRLDELRGRPDNRP